MSSSKKVRGVILVLFALWVNITTSGGIIYGLTSLTGLMDKEVGGLGQFWQKCKVPPDQCKERDHIYSNVFSISVGLCNVGTAIVGILMDYLGPKAAALIGLLVFGTGNYLVATTDSSKEDVDVAIAKFTIGVVLVGMGGQGPYISSYNIANVTRIETTITSLIAALFNFTGLTYFLFTIILDKVNMSVENQREFIGLVLTYVSIGQAVLVYLLWPVRAFAPKSDVERLFDFRLLKPRKVEDPDLHKALLASNERCSRLDYPSGKLNPTILEINQYVPLRKESAKVQLHSKEFLLGTAFFALSLLAMSFYLGTVFVQLDGKGDWLATNVLLQANLTPIVLAWPCALLLDRFGFSFGMGAACICSTIMYATLLRDSIPAYVISSVFLATFRCFLFATFFGYVGSMFGFDNYGIVVGIASLFTGVFGQLVIVLNWVAYRYDFAYVNVGLALATCLFIPLALTLGVWEWEGEDGAMIIGDQPLPILEKRDSFGSKVTYRWSRIATVTPRRLRGNKKTLLTE